MSISREAWLEALGPAAIPQEDDQDAQTVQEIATLLGWSRNTAQDHISRLVREGKATQTYKRLVRGDGRSMVARAYKLKP